MRRRRRNPDALALAKVGGAAVATVGVIGVGTVLGWFGPGLSFRCLFGCTPQERAANQLEDADEQTRVQLIGVAIAAAAALAGAGEKPGTLLRGLAYGGLAVAAIPYVDAIAAAAKK